MPISCNCLWLKFINSCRERPRRCQSATQCVTWLQRVSLLSVLMAPSGSEKRNCSLHLPPPGDVTAGTILRFSESPESPSLDPDPQRLARHHRVPTSDCVLTPATSCPIHDQQHRAPNNSQHRKSTKYHHATHSVKVKRSGSSPPRGSPLTATTTPRFSNGNTARHRSPRLVVRATLANPIAPASSHPYNSLPFLRNLAPNICFL